MPRPSSPSHSPPPSPRRTTDLLATLAAALLGTLAATRSVCAQAPAARPDAPPSAPAAPLVATPRRAELVPERAQRLQGQLAAEVESGRHAGLAFVLFAGEQLLADGAFGLADVERGRPFRRDTIVRIYSMTKPITAVAVLTLVEQGRLRLDTPIGELVPELAAPQVWTGGTAAQPETTPAARPITVRMLLTHTAGLTYDFFRESPVQQLYRQAELWNATSTDDFVRRLGALPLLVQPGTAWHYSVADDVLGVVVERAARRPFVDYVREHVTAPLGMVDTGFDVPAADHTRLAVVHRRDGATLVAAPATFGTWAEAGKGFAAGGSGMFSTLDDYARFARFLLGDGSLDGVRVLGRKTLEQARRDALGAGLGTGRPADGWGLITAVRRDPGAASDPMSAGTLHWNGAATTTFFADPVEDLVGVLFAQHLPFDEHHLIDRFRVAVYQALR